VELLAILPLKLLKSKTATPKPAAWTAHGTPGLPSPNAVQIAVEEHKPERDRRTAHSSVEKIALEILPCRQIVIRILVLSLVLGIRGLLFPLAVFHAAEAQQRVLEPKTLQ